MREISMVLYYRDDKNQSSIIESDISEFYCTQLNNTSMQSEASVPNFRFSFKILFTFAGMKTNPI